MDTLYSFPCILAHTNQSAILEIKNQKLHFHLANQSFDVEISYQLYVKWKCRNSKLLQVHFNQLIIEAQSDKLQTLKKYLDGKTTYLGIRELYKNDEELKKKRGTIKTCNLISKLDTQKYIGKCFKKSTFEKYRIYEQLVILRKLENQKNVGKLIDFYESSNSYYIIFEPLKKIQYHNLTHEDIQSMMFDILGAIKSFILNQIKIKQIQSINNSIFHDDISLKNIRIDDNMNYKLIGYENAELITEQQHLYNQQMIAQCGKLMLKLYQKYLQNNEIIPDQGNSLISQLIQYELNIEEALSHEYFAYFDYNSSPMQSQMIVPKLKSYLSTVTSQL